MFDWFWKLLYNLAKTILYCIDFILDFSKKLAGIDLVNVEGEYVELTSYFLMSDTVMEAFAYVALIGTTLLFLFTAYSVVRSVGRAGEGKTPIQVCIDSAKYLFYLLLIPAIMIIGSACISVIMGAIYKATSGGASSLGGRMFTLIAHDAYDYDEAFREDIFYKFANRANGYNYYSNANVGEYFKWSDLNYFLAFFGGFTVLFMLIKPMMTFVERTVSLVLLFIVAPISVSSAALDEGARFKLWREQVINKFLIAYGALISINIFCILVELVYNIQFFDPNTVSNADFLNGLARMLFIIGGASACKMAPVVIGNLVNYGAGSQFAQDQAHLSSPFSAVGHMAMGAAGAVGGFVGSKLGHVAAMPAKHVGKDISAAVHRSSNARRDVKAENARENYRSSQSAGSSRGGNAMTERTPGDKPDIGAVLLGGTDTGSSRSQVSGIGTATGMASRGSDNQALQDQAKNLQAQSQVVQAMSGALSGTSASKSKGDKS